MRRSLLLLVVLRLCSVCAWQATVSSNKFGVIRNSRGRGKRRSRPVLSSWQSQEHRCRRRSREYRSGRSRVSMASKSDDTPDDSEESSATAAWSYGKGKEWVDDGRDSLPFEVYDVVPPKRKIGTAKLPPLTSSGDTMWHGAKHYRVLRVSSHYKYEGGRFVMRKKVIDAKELARVAREQVVARLVYGDGKPPRES